MAGELDATNQLAPQPSQALQSRGVGSSAFQAADAFTLQHEGGATHNDGIGHTANQGIDQNAHPGINVLAMTPAQTQAMRHQYWTAVNGDALAQRDPRLALVAYETAIASGPAVAQKFLAQSGGDVNQLMKLRVDFMNGLVQRDPAKYGPVAQGWANRNRDLASAAGLDPRQFGLPAGGAQRMAAVQPQDQTSQGGGSVVNEVSNRLGPSPALDLSSVNPKPENPEAPATAPAGAAPQAAPLPQLSPMQTPAAPAKSNVDLYLELLKQPKAVA